MSAPRGRATECPQLHVSRSVALSPSFAPPSPTPRSVGVEVAHCRIAQHGTAARLLLLHEMQQAAVTTAVALWTAA